MNFKKPVSIVVLFLTMPYLFFANSNRVPAGVTNSGYNTDFTIKGQQLDTVKTNLLLKELNQTNYKSSPSRRFEIIFFSSLPVTLFISYTILELMIRYNYDKNNPNKEFQKPHYIYMFSSSIATSFMLALDDYRARKGINYTPPEFRFNVPFFHLKF